MKKKSRRRKTLHKTYTVQSSYQELLKDNVGRFQLASSPGSLGIVKCKCMGLIPRLSRYSEM